MIKLNVVYYIPCKNGVPPPPWKQEAGFGRHRSKENDPPWVAPCRCILMRFLPWNNRVDTVLPVVAALTVIPAAERRCGVLRQAVKILPPSWPILLEECGKKPLPVRHPMPRGLLAILVSEVGAAPHPVIHEVLATVEPT